MGSRTGTRPGVLVRPTAALSGPHRATERGQPPPAGERAPAWARSSPAAQTVWAIGRYGLAGNMTAHERPVFILAAQQMLRERIPSHVRAALRRQLLALGVPPTALPSARRSRSR